MSERTEFNTWLGLRGVPDERDWMTLGELLGLLRQLGVNMSRWQVAQAVSCSPPKKERGIKQYTNDHFRLCCEATRSSR